MLLYILQDAPEIKTPYLQIKETKTGFLNCSVSSKPASNITWSNGHGIAITEGLVKGSNFLSLNLTDVSREAAGQYLCSANNGIGDEVHENATLVVTCKLTFKILRYGIVSNV